MQSGFLQSAVLGVQVYEEALVLQVFPSLLLSAERGDCHSAPESSSLVCSLFLFLSLFPSLHLSVFVYS